MGTAAYPAADSPEHEAASRACYEAGRRRVAGRPAWGQLNPRCGYDLGMIEVAYAEGRLALEKKAAAIAPGPRRGLGGPLFGSRRPA
ncbi:MAG: hypothetical protein MIN69_00480 [Methylorubrum extorquens]|jgi:hypothetical protein|uniref:hypothetical protein n=1 Tax=Methylorubrum extorquens TaxID=408 RepID=UPI002FEE3479